MSCRSARGHGKRLDPLQSLALVGTCLPWSPSWSMKLGETVCGSWPACSCSPLPSPAPTTPARHPLHFDIFSVTLDFIHRCHELEANAVALIYCKDLCGESRGEQGWAGQGASLDGGAGVTLTFSMVCAV